MKRDNTDYIDSIYLNNKIVLVAGATGLVGSSIIRHILQNCPNTIIRASINRTSTNIIYDKRVQYIHGDLRSSDHCINIAKDCDYIIMAAANTSGSNILINDPWEQINDNIIMNTQMLRAFCNEERIKRIIYISSSTVYQQYDYPIKEDDIDLNQEPHLKYFGVGWTMRFIEKMCKLCYERYKKEIIIVRASNIFGPYAKFDPKVSNFIPAIIRKATDRMDPFKVWGDPNIIRDVLYTDDLARAILIMTNRDDIKFDIFNIGYGKGISVDKIVKLILEYCDFEPSKIEYDQTMPTTIKSRILDCTKAKHILGWKPIYKIEDGLKNTIDWWINNRYTWNK